jgi:membrane fusion protein (multidrug efflux system)
MSDSLKKVLLGAVLGALLVGFAWHIRNERAKHEPASSMGPPGGARPAGGPGPGDGKGAGKATPGAMSGGGASQRPVAVVVAPARVERLAVELEALGTARANESVDIASKVSNLVVAVGFDEGQKVRRGDLLVELDGEQARADVAIAEAALKESRSQYDRSRELYSTKVLSESQLDQIEATLKANEARVAAARSRLGDLQIRAPFAGRVGLRRISVGSLVGPGTIITTLDDTDTMKVDFTVPEAFLAAVTPGLAISARSVSYPDQTFSGKVASVDSRVDPSTRSVIVRALVPNPAGLLKPGMFLTVRLARDATDTLVVPEQALVPEQGDMFVFLVTDGTVEKRLVRIGQRRVGNVQIVQGLAAGDLVVTEGTQKLRDGSQVLVAKDGADAPPAADPPPAAVKQP